ncbi:hypothetical protein PCC9214_01479 [Planktothrix tepida]|uniref:Tyr recombinase domain-containing protein n=1 Tax=Planktothrix tepida PCC 9214 TaxID=671072 RepID=A0A1J1LIQ8_9CYAN|nr:hypothetical protein [Planktothrix tepida]CAD5934000.1 hypothetical protein PCC9214_01479 [Planktothrix tepida]CUR31764.1 conserved hypothetical protein [Planktothrix tepida PCC 9214]
MSNGTYNQLSDLITFYNRKRKECPKGVSLKLHDNRLLFLQFIDPSTSKRTSRACNVTFTEKGILDAVDKAYKVAEALKRFTTSSDFWNWYGVEIIDKNIIENDLVTYREIFKQIEDNFFKGRHRNTGRKRERDINKPGGASDIASFRRQYGVIFDMFPNWDTYPTWEELKNIWFTLEQGTKSFKDAKTTMLAIAELTPNNTKLLKQIKSVNATQTKFKEKQSISLDEFLSWYKEAYSSIEFLDREDRKLSKKSWLWVSAMCVLYGLRPSEIAASLNLDKPYTKDGVTIHPITDSVNNPECTIVVGEFTYFGTSTKTGFRVINPVPLKHLWEELKITDPLLPIYSPKPDSKPETIASGFDHLYDMRMKSYKCPITQKYAFRHLYNQLLEMCGINTSVRSRLMGHSETTNQGTYKKRRNLKTELNIINSVNKKTPLTLDIVKTQLESSGFDLNDPSVKAMLKIIYQLDD